MINLAHEGKSKWQQLKYKKSCWSICMNSLRNYFSTKFIGRRCYSRFNTDLKLLEQDILQKHRYIDGSTFASYKTLEVNNFLCLRGVYASGRQDVEPRKINETVEGMDQILVLIYHYIYFLYLKKRHSMSITYEYSINVLANDTPENRTSSCKLWKIYFILYFYDICYICITNQRFMHWDLWSFTCFCRFN